MTDWTPKLKGKLDLGSLNLDEEEGFVFSQIDGSTSIRQLHSITGIPEERIGIILRHLIQLNCLDLTSVPSSFSRSVTVRKSTPENDESANHVEQAVSADQSSSRLQAEDDVDFSRNYRKYFETRLHPLSRDRREELALKGSGTDLLALCYDPEHPVIMALLKNMETGLPHARLIAEHHRNPRGLEALIPRQQFINDEVVQKFLLRNVQSSVLIIKKMIGRKPLLNLYRYTISGELSQRAKREAHTILRARFQKASGDECVALILKTDGRCLNALTGIPLNGATIALLCGRTYHSTFLIQNLARWSSTPPKLLQHLYRQPMVKRAHHLKTMILQHPNCPSSLKAQG